MKHTKRKLRNWTRYTMLLGILSHTACQCGDNSGLSSVAPDLIGQTELIDFGDVAVGEFKYRSLELSNPGSGALEIVATRIVSDSTEIAMESTSPTVIAPKGKIELLLRYDPTNLGLDEAELHIETKDRNVGTKTFTLKGNGVSRNLSVKVTGPQCDGEANSLSFGEIELGSNKTLSFTLLANGGSEVRILSVVLSANTSSEFSLSEFPTSGQAIAPGEELKFDVTYAPADAGPDQGAVIITTDIPQLPSLRISLCGTGAGPALCGRPVPLNLGTVGPQVSATGKLSLESCGTQDLTISFGDLSANPQYPTASGFGLANPISAPLILAPGNTVDLDLSFVSSQIGDAQGHVYVTSNSVGQPENYFPVDAKVGQPCTISIAPSAVSFYNIAAGSSAESSILIANDGATDCSVENLSITLGQAAFAVVNLPQLPHIITPGASYVLTLRYTPQMAGPEMGELSVLGNGSTQTVALFGNPMLADGCQLDVRPSYLSFGVVEPGSINTLGVDVENISSDPCTIRGVRLEPGASPDLSSTSRNFGFILPGRTKQLSVTYQPLSSGSTASGTLKIETTDVDTPDFLVPVSGACGQTGICVSPLHLPFGNTNVQDMMNVNIYACGSTDVTVTALDWTVGDAELSLPSPLTLPLTLRSGDMQAVAVRYSPADMTSDEAELTVRSNDLVNPNIPVRVTGGPEVVPAEAGRFMYYWQIANLASGGDIMQLPLQGQTTARPYWGPRAGKGCTGCHEVSPDGRYVAMIEIPSFQVVDTTVDQALVLPMDLLAAEYVSWNPDVNTTPPYQFAYAAGGKIYIASIFAGQLRELQGANNASDNNSMPTWGSNGSIAFVRGQTLNNTNNGGSGYSGPTDIYVISESGGTAQLLAGASGNSFANYYPRFSPNGLWIAFTQSQSAMSTLAASDGQIKLVKSDQSGLVLDLNQLNGPAGNASSYPTWSVNGAYLSFSSDRMGGLGDWDIWIAPIDPITGMDGPAVNVAVANTPQFEHAAQWSP
jgi:hypothetical protein